MPDGQMIWPEFPPPAVLAHGAMAEADRTRLARLQAAFVTDQQVEGS